MLITVPLILKTTQQLIGNFWSSESLGPWCRKKIEIKKVQKIYPLFDTLSRSCWPLVVYPFFGDLSRCCWPLVGYPVFDDLSNCCSPPILLGACCVTIKSRVTTHANLIQVLEQIENGYPQKCNHQRNCHKNVY